jgi:hypothetical protein
MAAVTVFALPDGAEPRQIVHDDPSGQPIVLSLQ